MHTLQRVTENLLLVTAASRAMLQLAEGSGFAIHAEAVQHAQPQIRHRDPETGAQNAEILAILQRDQQLIVQQDTSAAPGSIAQAAPSGIRAQMLAPLIRDGRFTGVIALHATEPREWSAQDQQAMLDAQSQILDFLKSKLSLESPEDLRSAAVQAILDGLRIQLDVQRCTFRQPVQAAFAFPVTFESRAAGMRSLLGDFTIVQTGQPVIVKLLAGRAQVIQDDCNTASQDPLFHKMLAHYGGMRAQMVTPFIVGDQLKGVLSVHELRHARTWTSAEKALAAEAAALIGTILELPYPQESATK